MMYALGLFLAFCAGIGTCLFLIALWGHWDERTFPSTEDWG